MAYLHGCHSALETILHFDGSIVTAYGSQKHQIMRKGGDDVALSHAQAVIQYNIKYTVSL